MSVEFVDGQACTGKSDFVNSVRDNKQNIYEIINACQETDHDWMFLKPEQDCPTCMDFVETSLALNVFTDFLSLPQYSRKFRLLVNGSLFSQGVKEFWWRRLFPLIKKELSNNNSWGIPEEVGVSTGWTAAVNAAKYSSKVQDALEHFGAIVLGICARLDRCAEATVTSLVVYLAFADPDDRVKQEAGAARRAAQGGHDAFLRTPLEGEDAEDAGDLYSAGESLLWNVVWRVALSGSFERLRFVRLETDENGLLVPPQSLLGNDDDDEDDPYSPPPCPNLEHDIQVRDGWYARRASKRARLYKKEAEEEEEAATK